MGLLACCASFAACHFSPFEVIEFLRGWPTGALCTFQNFLHGVALLPQLVLSRGRGFIAPAAARFLLIIGVKHIVELAADLVVSYGIWKQGKMSLHEASFISGDLFAAVILADFLYLVAVS